MKDCTFEAFELREELYVELVNTLLRSATLPAKVETALLENLEELASSYMELEKIGKELDKLADDR